MRVTGNFAPPDVRLWPVDESSRVMEIRITENARKVTTDDGEMWEYDEYTFFMEETGTLEYDIRHNMEDWLKTGRSMEYNPKASELFHMEEENTEELAELIEMLYESDLEVIDNV